MPGFLHRLGRAAEKCDRRRRSALGSCSRRPGARPPGTSRSRGGLGKALSCVTMQNESAPAASAARACSRICSGSLIACIGVSASAKRVWGAEAAVLGAAARLGVDQRAHVGRVRRSLHPRLPGSLDRGFDLPVVLEPPSQEGLLACKKWPSDRHAPNGMGCARLDAAAADPAGRSALGEGAHALADVLDGERRPAQLDQLLLDLPRAAAPSAASSASITRLLPVCESGALPASSAARSSATSCRPSAGATRLTSPRTAPWRPRCSGPAGTAPACGPRRSRR